MDSVSPWVRRWAPLAPRGTVLDLACGNGRHARHFASLGHDVLALDRDGAALAAAAGTGITTRQIDLEDRDVVWPFDAAAFGTIVVTNYLHRPLFAHLAASLAPHGVLIYETFAEGNGALGKPSNPAFLLAEGELLALAGRHGWRVLAFEDGYTAAPKPAMVQRLFACGPDFSRAKADLGAAGQGADARF